ncbi:GH3 auxin-responsive promoter family protein [Portibacter marinus]|uniref:GH3 auxin-responsive promoter family protein n=1 Tax=Portibacter marinus TaxID=2898660 RepID=UPI001F3F0354|nr:GH3 auxin-responsive promoter family protein [Portibacter marinus]
MKAVFNKIISTYLERRYQSVQHFMEHPIQTQLRTFNYLIGKASNTEWGKKHQYSSINSRIEFRNKVPLNEYDDLEPYILRMMNGSFNILWPGFVNWYAKSSGTTSSKSKFIPVPKENLRGCHIKGSWDVVTLLYKGRSDARVFERKNLVMGGSLSNYEKNHMTTYGDISAIMLYNMPLIGRPFYTPDFRTALLPNWDEKIEKMVQICSKEEVTMFGGVPSWTIVLFRKILEATGKDNILEVWPEVQAYVHGGVGFEPYRSTFEQFIPSDDFTYLEVYNASEGYFAIQNDLKSKDLLLLLDNGIYYEFLPMSEFEQEDARTITLEEVELDVNYAMVISTNAGLWRYMTGDTVKFTSLQPYKIKITGRTKHFINAFGEEVMVSNTDKALAMTCKEFDVEIADYTVAPIYFSEGTKGGHQWLIEFEKNPDNLTDFSEHLDLNLQKVNSDYEAKRYKSMALENLTIEALPRHTFYKWMEKRGKLGGQNKVPRLSNNRKYVDDILNFMSEVHGYQ